MDRACDHGAKIHLEHVVAAAFATAACVWMKLLATYHNVLSAYAGVIIVARGKDLRLQI